MGEMIQLVLNVGLHSLDYVTLTPPLMNCLSERLERMVKVSINMVVKLVKARPRFGTINKED